MKLKLLIVFRVILSAVLILYGLLVFFALHKLLYETADFGMRQMGLFLVFLFLLAMRFCIARHIKRQKALLEIRPFYAQLPLDTDIVLKWVLIGMAAIALCSLFIGLLMLYNAKITDFAVSVLTDDEREKMAMVALPLTYICIVILCYLMPSLVRLVRYINEQKRGS